MADIEEVYGDLDTDVSLEEFREAVEAKVEQMGGLADEETAAMLIAHELDDGEVNGIADVTPEMDEAKFLAKVTSIGEMRTFERDGEEEEDGRVVNVDVADETGAIRATFWDEQAVAAGEELAVGDVLRLKGRPKEGYNGVEINVSQVEIDEDEEIDVQVQDEYRVDDLSLGLSDVTLVGQVLGTDDIRTFDRDDGSEGQVSNVLVGDDSGRVRLTLWDEQAPLADEFEHGDVIEIVDGYVRERDGDLELHVGDRGDIHTVDEPVEFVPETMDIDALEIDTTVDIAGVIRSADPKREFDRDDGSTGQVRNVRVQDETGDIRVALWSEKADIDIGPGDEVLFVDVEIQDGWQDDLEASAGWQSTVIPLADGALTSGDDGPESTADADADAESGSASTGLGAFADDAVSDSTSAGSDSDAGDDTDAGGAAPTTGSGGGAAMAQGEHVEFTGVVVQAGDPVILDDGEETVSVDTDVDVELGQEITVEGELQDGRLTADSIK